MTSVIFRDKDTKKSSKKISVTLTVLIVCSVLAVMLLFGTFYLHGFETIFIHIQSIRIAFVIFIFACLIAPTMILVSFAKNVKKGTIYAPKRRWKVIILIGLLLPLTLFSIGTFSSYVRYEDKQPILLMTESNGIHGVSNMGVCFWTETPTVNRVEWGELGNDGTVITEPQSVKEHCFMLRDLLPNTTYWYTINNDKTYNFTTPSLDGTLRFACAGDLHFGKSNMKKDIIESMLTHIIDNGTDLFFGLGDWVDSGFFDFQWKNCFETCSPYLTRIPTGSIIGNHDAMFNGFELYEDYFSPQGMDKENGNGFWKHIEVGNAHFFLLRLEWGVETFSDAQKMWLIDELTSVPDDEWKIVMTHAPMFVSGGDRWFYVQSEDIKENVDTFAPIFEQNGVDMVLSGHTHRMEAMEKNGIFYGIAGSFGSNSWEMSITETGANTLWIQDDTFGYMDISLNGTNGTITFVDNMHTELFSYNTTSY